MKWKSLFAAALSAAVTLPAWAQDATGGGTPAEGGGRQQSTGTAPGRAISVNFAGGDGYTYSLPADFAYGLVPAANWNNPEGSEQTDFALNTSSGTASGATLTYKANGTYSYTQAGIDITSEGTDQFLCHFLGDNTHDGGDGITINVANIPFETYDVIVYLSTDTAAVPFLPVSINGTNKYIGDPDTGATVATDDATATFGKSRATKPTYGRNAIRINGLTGDALAIQGSKQKRQNDQPDGAVVARCNIAGFQIVESLPLSISVNLKGTANGNFPHYPETLVGDTTGFSGLVPVVNANWNEVETPAGNGSTPGISGAKDATGAETTATINLAIGGGWTLKGPSQEAQEVQNARTTRIGKMGLGYADASKNTTPEVTLSDIPYTKYSVILYYATDNPNMKWAPAKVTAGGTKTYYYYDADGTLKDDGKSSSTWGSSNDCIAAETTGKLGKDTMRIDGLSGDVSIDLDTSSNTDNTRGGLSGLQIVCTGEVIPPPPPTINVNFASGRPGEDTSHDCALTGDTTYGLEPVPGSEWTNLYKGDRNNDVALAVCNGETAVVPTVTYDATGMWSYEEDIEGINALLVAALEDGSALSGTSYNTTITVSDVPFTQYDVIVYLQAAGNGGGFKPVEVNDTYYAWQNGATQAVADSSDTYAWGMLAQPQPALGVNALRISDQTARELTINAPKRTGGPNDSKRCNVTGFQIVCTGEVIEDFLDPAKKGVISLNFNSGANNSAIPATETKYGLVAVPGNKWQNLTGTSNTTGVPITRALNTDLARAPSVTFSSTGGYQYDADQATCPYLRAYLDDDGSTKVTGVDVDVTNVPYQAYDVVVYFGMGDADNTFRPVAINGTYYRWDDAVGATVPTEASGAAFGTSAQVEADYGVNAIRVKAQTGNLDLDAQPRNPSAYSERGGIAALQLVERKVIKVTGTGFDLAGPLAAYEADTPVLITFTDGATVTGDVTLPADAVVDLTAYTFGETAPFGGTLTVNEGTEIRLPGGAVSYTLATSISGTRGLVMQDGAYITDASISGGTITRPATYKWTGAGDNDNWSNPDNWIDGVPPETTSAVTIPLADGAKKTITLTKGAVAGSLSITGPASGTATLTITGAENGSLTISGQMLTTGNVAVTQNANIDVAGTSQMGDNSPIPANQVVQAGFQVNGSGATYTVASGALEVGWQGTDGAGDVSVSNGATLEVSEAGSLYAAQAIASYFGNAASAASGTLSIAGTATFSTQMGLASQNFTVELAGGIMTTPSVRTFNGLSVSAGSTLAAPEGKELTVSGTNSALSGEGSLTLQGAVTFSSAIAATYTGELTAAAGSTVTLGENRPKLSVAEDARVNITPTASEQVSGVASFVTSMADAETVTGVTVAGVTEEIAASVSSGTLTLSWNATNPTLAQNASWSETEKWTNLTDGALPASGTVVLDGSKAPITVTLNTIIPATISSIIVRGDVTLVTTEDQATLPTCIALADEAILGVGATHFAKAEGSEWPTAWAQNANSTLRITDAGFTFENLELFANTYACLAGDVVVTASGTAETPVTLAPTSQNPLRIEKTLTVFGNYVTFSNLYMPVGAVTLSGNGIILAKGGARNFVFGTGCAVTSSGVGNAITGVTNWNGTLAVTGGDLTIDSCNTLAGALITNGGTLKLAADWAPGQELKVSAGDDTATTLDLSAVNPANRPTLNRYSDTYKTLPKTIVVAPSEAEAEAGVIDITLLQDLALAADAVVQVVAEPAWNPAWEVVTEGGKKLRITNVVLKPVLPEGSTLSEAATAALNTAAEQAGITGEYAVAITTGDATVQVTTAADVARLQEVLECFTGVATGDSASNTVTVAYDFGITGIKRNTADNGWTVTAKVQGAAGAKADFADGNVYTLTVNGAPAADASATVGENGTVTFTVPDASVAGETCTLGVKVSRPEQTPAQ